MNVQIEESWKAHLQPEFEKDYFRLSMFPQILVCFAEMLVPEEAVISG